MVIDSCVRFSCFITLLFLAAVLWKVKVRVELYRRRQRMFVEMAQMASRPFGSVQLELGGSAGPKRRVSPVPSCITAHRLVMWLNVR